MDVKLKSTVHPPGVWPVRNRLVFTFGLQLNSNVIFGIIFIVCTFLCLYWQSLEMKTRLIRHFLFLFLSLGALFHLPVQGVEFFFDGAFNDISEVFIKYRETSVVHGSRAKRIPRKFRSLSSDLRKKIKWERDLISKDRDCFSAKVIYPYLTFNMLNRHNGIGCPMLS